MSIARIAVFASESALSLPAQALAQELNLPLADNPELYDYVLILTSDYLGLQKKGDKLPLYIDFLSGQLTYRRQHSGLRRESLARAMGLKAKIHPTIVDATAGLGRDSFILASLGFNVILLERSPLIHALLKDAITRALQNPEVAAIANRMQLVHTDAITWMQQVPPQHRPNIIYLDPMFPDRTKSALVKKDMRIFNDVIGNDPDSDLLFTTALTCATQRVVVKRSRLAANLAGISPAFCLKGSSSRFDVYMR
jgi:16S rRNA (guanine1516-N2)-methyltransferase